MKRSVRHPVSGGVDRIDFISGQNKPEHSGFG
jgi:hypothetical protein